MGVGVILKQIFGGGEVIKAGIELIDSIHTSDEEEIAAKAQAKTDLLNAYAPFKLAQRLLALMFCGTYLFCFFACLVLMFMGHTTKEILELLNAFYIPEITFTIVVFYFGGGFIEGGLVARAKGKALVGGKKE